MSEPTPRNGGPQARPTPEEEEKMDQVERQLRTKIQKGEELTEEQQTLADHLDLL